MYEDPCQLRLLDAGTRWRCRAHRTGRTASAMEVVQSALQTPPSLRQAPQAPIRPRPNHPRHLSRKQSNLVQQCVPPKLDCWNQPTAFCTCYVNERQVSGCDPPACYDPTLFNCRDTVKQRGWQTLSPCKGVNCAGKCTITAGYPWDDDCRPEVGNN